MCIINFEDGPDNGVCLINTDIISMQIFDTYTYYFFVVGIMETQEN